MFHHHLVLSQTLTEKPTSSDCSQARQAQRRRPVYNCLAVRNVHVTKQQTNIGFVMFNQHVYRTMNGPELEYSGLPIT